MLRGLHFLFFLFFAFGSALALPKAGEEQCLVVLTEAQYRATSGLWANVRREEISSKPGLFQAIIPGISTFEWIEPTLPAMGSEERKRMEDIGAHRWAVVTPQNGGDCYNGRFGSATEHVQRSGIATSVAYTAATQNRLVQIGMNSLLPLVPTTQSTTRSAVAVIDSGVNVGARELQQRVAVTESISFVGGLPFDDPTVHGTLVAELIAGRSFGMTTSTPIISYKVMETVVTADGNKIAAGSEAYVLRAILRLHTLKYERIVVNMSLQLWGNPYLWRLAIKSLEKKALFVAAAGNGYGLEIVRNSNYLPASVSDLPNLIVVGGTDGQDKRINFSNRGSAVQIGAPGVVETSYGTVQGTSFSAPQVSGTAARMIEVSDTLPSPAALKSAILRGSRFAAALFGEFAEPKVLNVAGAIQALEESEVATTSPMSNLRVTRVYGTWSGSEKLTYSDLVTIEGEFGEEELQVYLNNDPVTVLSKTSEKIEVTLPSMFRTAVWNGGMSNLSVARLSNGVPDANSAVLALSFQPEISQPGIGVVARENGPASEQNPIRAGETVSIFLSGVESFAASRSPIELNLGGVTLGAVPEKTQVAGIFSVRAEVPCIRGQYGIVIKANARATSNEFGVNYTDSELE